jgi:hypothetical protein
VERPKSRHVCGRNAVEQVFMSYSRKDKDFVRQLNDAFVGQKREAWVDWKDISLTVEWQQEILNRD